MKLPPFVLTDKVMVETYKGQGARGAIYEHEAPVDCQVKWKRRNISGPDGADVVSEATVLADPKDKDRLTVLSRVTIDGKKTRVLERRVPKDLTGPAYVKAFVA